MEKVYVIIYDFNGNKSIHSIYKSRENACLALEAMYKKYEEAKDWKSKYNDKESYFFASQKVDWGDTDTIFVKIEEQELKE